LAIPTDAELEQAQWLADPHADAAVAAILGVHAGKQKGKGRLDRVVA
jgi:hypothetical protein